MTLNVGSKRRARPGSRGSAASATAPLSDRALVNEVIDELTSWNPREFVAAFQRWHHGSVSLVHLNVLTLIEAHGPLSMSRLADALDISVASATGVVDRMEKRGLVERRRDLEDRRVVLVHPARGARRLFGEIDGRRRRGLAKVLEKLADDDLAGLLRGHRALRAARMAVAAEAEPGPSGGEVPA